ncbi:MAG: hypothetical protein ACJAYN_000344 [Bermanella sp.]|jgi:hypothetical protein
MVYCCLNIEKEYKRQYLAGLLPTSIEVLFQVGVLVKTTKNAKLH